MKTVNCDSRKSQVGITSFFWSGTFQEFPKLAAYWERCPPIVVKSSWTKTQKFTFFLPMKPQQRIATSARTELLPVWPTISIVVVDSAQPPRGCQVFGCDSHVDGVAQVKLYSYAKAAFYKHKVSQPVHAHSFTKMTRSIQSVKQVEGLTESVINWMRRKRTILKNRLSIWN